MERPNAWLSYSEADMNQLEDVAKKYRHFLNVGKTERECITQIVKEAEEAGYVSLEEKVKKGEALKAGDKVYTVGMKKIIALYHIGSGRRYEYPLRAHRFPKTGYQAESVI